MSNKILLVFEKYDLILFFKFFTPARKTIEKRMAKVLLYAMGREKEITNKIRQG
jgi:hypothetical protein